MTRTEKTMLADLLNKYQAEQKQSASQQTGGGADMSLKALLDAGYQIVPPNQSAQSAQTGQTGNDIDATLRRVLNGMQSINVQNVQQPNQQSTDDILASIINPPLPDFGKEANGGFFKSN